MKSRGSTEIIGLILQSVENEPLARSKIMYQAILNFKQVSDYAAYLTEAGLLTYLLKIKNMPSQREGNSSWHCLKKQTVCLLLRFMIV